MRQSSKPRKFGTPLNPISQICPTSVFLTSFSQTSFLESNKSEVLNPTFWIQPTSKFFLADDHLATFPEP